MKLEKEMELTVSEMNKLKKLVIELHQKHDNDKEILIE